MKKLFLTSGIIACMACPAFATGFDASNGAIPANAGDDACVSDTLGTTTGPVQLQAQWQQNWETINLDKNTSYGGDTDSNAVITPAQLWAVINTAASGQTPNGGVYNAYTGTIGQDDFTPTTPVAANGTITMSAPDGITTTYTFDDGSASVQGREPTGSASATTPIRQLTEFNSAADGTGTTYINVSADNQTYTLTSAGESAAQNATVGTPLTWYAQYDCATPVITNTLALDGYQFAGWTYSNGADVNLSNHCETLGTQELTAQWAPIEYQINFDCNNQGTATGTLNGSNNVAIDMDASTILNQYCTMPGYVFQGWTCGAASGSTGALSDGAYSTNPNAVTTINANANHQLDNTTVYLTTYGNVTCTARWQQNTIDLYWDANSADTITSTGGDSCIYDGDVTVPVVSRTGYVLTGWTVTATETSVGTPVTTANTTQLP